jgi:hypothetical protein
MNQARPREDHDHELWVSVASAAATRVMKRHKRMITTYGLTGGTGVRYHWSSDDAAIVWSRGGRHFLRGRITSIGSVNAQKQSWLWSWANKSVPAAALGGIDEAGTARSRTSRCWSGRAFVPIRNRLPRRRWSPWIFSAPRGSGVTSPTGLRSSSASTTSSPANPATVTASGVILG